MSAQSSETEGHRETPSMILPAAMPEQLGAAVDAAARRAEALAASGRELHFQAGASGELTVQLRDPAGNVLKTLTPTQAIGLMGGLAQV